VLDGERETPLRNAVILIEDGRIAQIGTRAKVKVPKGVPTVKGTGLTVIPGVRAEGWSVSDFGWGPGALARGIVGVRLAPQSDASLGEVRTELQRDAAVAPRLLGAADTLDTVVLREGGPADFVVVEGLLRRIPRSPSRVRWVAIDGRLYSARELREVGG
jgi:hypothetical protein